MFTLYGEATRARWPVGVGLDPINRSVWALTPALPPRPRTLFSQEELRGRCVLGDERLELVAHLRTIHATVALLADAWTHAKRGKIAVRDVALASKPVRLSMCECEGLAIRVLCPCEARAAVAASARRTLQHISGRPDILIFGILLEARLHLGHGLGMIPALRAWSKGVLLVLLLLLLLWEHG